MHSLKRVEEKVTTLCSSLDDFRVAQELPSFNPIQIEPYKNSIREFLLFDGTGDLSKYFAFTSCAPKGEFEPKYKVQEFMKSGNFLEYYFCETHFGLGKANLRFSQYFQGGER